MQLDSGYISHVLFGSYILTVFKVAVTNSNIQRFYFVQCSVLLYLKTQYETFVNKASTSMRLKIDQLHASRSATLYYTLSSPSCVSLNVSAYSSLCTRLSTAAFVM